MKVNYVDQLTSEVIETRENTQVPPQGAEVVIEAQLVTAARVIWFPEDESVTVFVELPANAQGR